VSDGKEGVKLGDIRGEMRLLYVAATRGKEVVEIGVGTQERVAIATRALAVAA
jgi:ATP-dependent exoDNAse (exonuclease V) beta subunit